MKIYQVEVSNLCNLSCSYCPHPRQSRAKGLMTFETFQKVVSLVQRCRQQSIYLHNFGEPLLHPDLHIFVRYATTNGLTASFFTNGTLLDPPTVRVLADAGLRVIYVSEHRRGEITRVAALLRETGDIRIGGTYRPAADPTHDWAGQVRVRTLGVKTGSDKPCIFERHRAVSILWDGRLSTCCIDIEGRADLGTVDDYLEGRRVYEFRAIDLCHGCNLMRGEEDLS